MVATIAPEDRARETAQIAAALFVSFSDCVDLETISRAVECELGRYTDVPVKEFIALLVERNLRTRLRTHGTVADRAS
jgi:hypothetical protein